MQSRLLQTIVARPTSQLGLLHKSTSFSSTSILATQKIALFHQSAHIKMKAARVKTWGSVPEYMDVPDLPAPSAGELQLKVLAVGVPRVVKARAMGKHHSAFNQPLPYDPSIDGVGLDELTGDKYVMTSFSTPLFSERVNIQRSQLIKLDPDSDPISIAAMTNPAISSWMALQCRAIGGCKGRTVVILGATSASGRAAAFVARELGAERVIGISRNEESLANVQGLDERVILSKPLTLPPSVGPVDIILDYVGGTTAVELMQSAEIKKGENLQYIMIGGLSGEENLVLPSRLINMKPIRIMASGIGSFSKAEVEQQAPGFINAISHMKRPFEVFAAPMADVQTVWESEEAETKRLVLVP